MKVSSAFIHSDIADGKTNRFVNQKANWNGHTVCRAGQMFDDRGVYAILAIIIVMFALSLIGFRSICMALT